MLVLTKSIVAALVVPWRQMLTLVVHTICRGLECGTGGTLISIVSVFPLQVLYVSFSPQGVVKLVKLVHSKHGRQIV